MTVPELQEGHRIIPVVVLDDAGAATDLVGALASGGIHCVEITLRTPAAFDAIAAVAGTPSFSVGAGTVISVEQLERVVDLGARFVVSPGLDVAVVERAHELGVGILPGVATATEVQRAIACGISVVKFFPAGQLGGLRTIDALAGPFPDLGFVPSGGVSAANTAEYLAHPSVPAISGSWMAPRELVRAGDFEQIRRLSAAAIEAVG